MRNSHRAERDKTHNKTLAQRMALATAVSVTGLMSHQFARGASGSWLGTTDNTWADANWSASPVPGSLDTATFGGAGNGNTTIDLGTGVTVGTIIFDASSAAAYTIGNGGVGAQTLTLSDGGAITMTAAETSNNELFNSAVVLGADALGGTFTFTNSSTTNSLTFAGNISGSPASGDLAATLAVAGVGSTIINGNISNGAGSLALAESGGANLFLGGPNSYTGSTTIDGSTMSLTANQSLTAATNNLTFGATAGSANVGTLNLNTASGTFGGTFTVQTASATVNTINIGSGQTLQLNGNVAIGTATASSTTSLTVSGAGSLNITNNGGTFTMGAQNNNAVVVNLSGLSNFNANLGPTGTFAIGEGSLNNATTTNQTLSLAANSTITAGTVEVGAYQGGTMTSGNAGIETMNLGSFSNVIDTNNLYVANTGSYGRSSGLVAFGSTTGTLLLQGQGGPGTTANVYVSDFSGTASTTVGGSINLGGSTSTAIDGGNANLNIGTLLLGMRLSSTGTAAFAFSGGTMSVNNLVIAEGTGTQTISGTLSLNGGNAIFNNSVVVGDVNSASAGTINATFSVAGANVTATPGIILGTGANTGTLHSTLSITAGTLTVGGNIIAAATGGTVTSAATLNGGTLNINGFDLGTSTNPIGTLSLDSGTLTNVAGLDGSGTTSLVKLSSSGTLTMIGTSTYTGQTVISAGTLSVSSIGNAGVAENIGAAAQGTWSGATSGTTPIVVAATTAALLYLGPGENTNRNIYLGPTFNDGNIATFSASGSGTLTLSGGLSAQGSNSTPGNSVLVLAGSNIGANTISGLIADRIDGSNNTYLEISKQGVGEWALTDTSNSFKGLLDDENGTLQFASVANQGSNSALGSGAQNLGSGSVSLPYSISIGSTSTGADLQFTGTSNSSSNRVIGLNGNGTLDTGTATGVLTLSGGVSDLTANGLTLTLAGNNADANTLSGAISNGTAGGSLTLAKTGSGYWQISGSNSYTGNTTINTGTLEVGGENALYADNTADWNTSSFTVASGATAIFGVGGAGQFTASDIQTLSSLGTLTGGFENDTTLGLDTGTNTFAYGNEIDNTNGGANQISLLKSGSGTLTLLATNTFTGQMIIQAGTVIVTSIGDAGVAGNLGQAAQGTFSGATVGTTPIELENTAVLDYTGAGESTDRNIYLSLFDGNTATFSSDGTGPLTLSGGVTQQGGNFTHGDAELVLSGANTGANTISGQIIDAAAGSFTYLAVSKQGAGLWALTNTSNSFEGLLDDENGTLQFASVANQGTASALGTGSASYNVTTALPYSISIGSTSTGADLQYIGTSNSATNRVIGLNGDGTIDTGTAIGTLVFSGALSNLTANGVTLALAGSNTGANAYSGTISDGTAGGSLALAKNGSGSWIIGGSNTYSGATTVTSGTLDVTGTLANSATVSVSAADVLATLILDSANALTAAAAITGTTTGTAIPVVTVNNSQTIASINSVGTTSFTGGTSIVGTGNGLGGSSVTFGGIDSTGTLNVTGSTLTAAHIRQSVVNIDSASTVTIADSTLPAPDGNGNVSGNSAAASVVTDLYNAGTLDLKNNDLIVNDSAQFTTVQAAIAASYDNGNWDQPGITSSSAKANSSTYGLGYATAAELGTTSFDGQPVASGSTIVKYTLLGDTNLKGSVGLGDLSTVLANIDGPGDWSQGNFHYNSAAGGGVDVGLGDLSDVLGNLDATVSGSIVKGAVTHSAITPSVAQVFNIAGPNDLQLNVNTQTGDVTLVNEAATTTAFTAYDIKVIDSSTNTLLVGNPADGNGSGINTTTNTPIPPNTEGQTGPFTHEMFLTAGSSDSNYNASAHAYGNNPSRWQIALDGYNGQGSAFGLAEAPLSGTKADEITLPVGASIDLGNIFNTLASQTDLQFTWQPTTSTGANQGSGGTTYNGLVDYIGSPTPEPATLGLLGLGGVMMMRRRRRAAMTSGI